MREEGLDILGIGMAVQDRVMLAAGYPAENTKLPAQDRMAQGGGPCATALVAAARLGAATAWAGVVGDDATGRDVLAELRDYGVCTGAARVAQGRTAHSSILVNSQNGSRTIVWDAGTAPEPTAADVPLDLLKKAKVLHLDNHYMDAALFAAKKAREWGVLVSLDGGTPYAGTAELLPYVDILVPCEGFVQKYTGCEDALQGAQKLVEQYRPKLFAMTQGERGGLVLHNGELVRYPAFLGEVVDTNGAGDVFHGAFLAALLRGLGAYEAARLASAVAGLSTRVLGTRGALPGWEKALALVQKEPCEEPHA